MTSVSVVNNARVATLGDSALSAAADLCNIHMLVLGPCQTCARRGGPWEWVQIEYGNPRNLRCEFYEQLSKLALQRASELRILGYRVDMVSDYPITDSITIRASRPCLNCSVNGNPTERSRVHVYYALNLAMRVVQPWDVWLDSQEIGGHESRKTGRTRRMLAAAIAECSSERPALVVLPRRVGIPAELRSLNYGTVAFSTVGDLRSELQRGWNGLPWSKVFIDHYVLESLGRLDLQRVAEMVSDYNGVEDRREKVDEKAWNALAVLADELQAEVTDPLTIKPGTDGTLGAPSIRVRFGGYLANWLHGGPDQTAEIIKMCDTTNRMLRRGIQV